MKHIKKFNENNTSVEDGFYWVKLKNENEWWIAKKDSSIGDKPWEIIASDDIFSDDIFIEIGPKIELPE